jgi:hypothetical protein
MMIFVPLFRAAAGAIRSAGRTEDDLVAFAATGEMIAAHGYHAGEREDADYAAQLYASLSGLIEAETDARVVVAAEVPIARVSDGAADREFGAIKVRGLDWADVVAVFVDGPAAAEAVRAARAAASAVDDQSLRTILELPEVAALTDDHELLWHNPDETW